MRRGPLLFALPLRPTVETLHVPAQGGECETNGTASCRSRDLAFVRGASARWNYALVFPNGAARAAEALTVHRKADRPPPMPFDTTAPPLTISVAARTVATWATMAGGKVVEPPPASPVDCSGADPRLCGDVETLELVPFGATQIRIGAFPWIAALDASEGAADAPPRAPPKKE